MQENRTFFSLLRSIEGERESEKKKKGKKRLSHRKNKRSSLLTCVLSIENEKEREKNSRRKRREVISRFSFSRGTFTSIFRLARLLYSLCCLSSSMALFFSLSLSRARSRFPLGLLRKLIETSVLHKYTRDMLQKETEREREREKRKGGGREATNTFVHIDTLRNRRLFKSYREYIYIYIYRHTLEQTHRLGTDDAQNEVE